MDTNLSNALMSGTATKAEQRKAFYIILDLEDEVKKLNELRYGMRDRNPTNNFYGHKTYNDNY